jgi:hypothetical protein
MERKMSEQENTLTDALDEIARVSASVDTSDPQAQLALDHIERIAKAAIGAPVVHYHQDGCQCKPCIKRRREELSALWDDLAAEPEEGTMTDAIEWLSDDDGGGNE